MKLIKTISGYTFDELADKANPLICDEWELRNFGGFPGHASPESKIYCLILEKEFLGDKI